MKYIFDTNAFNSFLDDDEKERFTSISVFASHIQLAEIHATQCKARKDRLLSVFTEITDEVKPTETMVFPLVFSSQKFGDGTYGKILDALNFQVSSLSGKKRKKKEKGHSNDAQIAEVALKNHYVLVTDDAELISVFSSLGGTVMRYSEFKQVHT